MACKFFIIPLEEVLKRPDTIKYINGAEMSDSGHTNTYNHDMNRDVKKAGLFGLSLSFEKYKYDHWWICKTIKSYEYKWHESWLSIYPPPSYKKPRVVVPGRSFVSYIEL